MTTHDYAPSGLTHPSKSVIKTPDELSPEIRELVNSLKRTARAHTSDEHRAALKTFEEDVQWDGPFALIHGKERVRLLSTLLKHFVDTDLDTNVVRIKMTRGDGLAVLDIDGILKLRPKKTIFFPPSYLLPSEIPIDVSTELGVKGQTDKIEYMKGRMHNLPALPYFLRYMAGWTLGSGAVLVESVYYQLMDWHGSGHSHRVGGYRAGSSGTGYNTGSGGPLSSVAQTTSHMTSNIGQTASNVAHEAKEKVEKVLHMGGGQSQEASGTYSHLGGPKEVAGTYGGAKPTEGMLFPGHGDTVRTTL